jgi:hypothetical protein
MVTHGTDPLSATPGPLIKTSREAEAPSGKCNAWALEVDQKFNQVG